MLGHSVSNKINCVNTTLYLEIEQHKVGKGHANRGDLKRERRRRKKQERKNRDVMNVVETIEMISAENKT